MQISRNRKRKNNHNNRQKTKTTAPTNFGKMFNMQFNECRKCEENRDEFAFDELPNEEQRHWERSEVVNQKAYYLYCPICDEYSAILEME